ncbi:CerR family C-terminal domain-containing protein [Parazoarcus communis]|uniref:CerR family C-terminal domain-containing protein n=1 Tax=Parazoarcus communis TaxID=41977 RepID=UPI00131EE710|nr:CerR family C-terminal domain-containing protein [Parazoarcus communis]
MTSNDRALPEVPGEATRARLVAAGLELFGSGGYDAVTTRSLAARAGVNQAAIPYHFGGKQGVYLAVAQYLCDANGGKIREAVFTARSGLEDPGADVGALLADFIVSCVDIVAGSEQGLLHYAFFVREQLSPSAAFDIIFDQMLLPVHQLVCDLVAHLKGAASDAEETILLAQAFLAQVSGFVTGRLLIQRRLKADALDLGAVLGTVRNFTIAAARGL